MKLEGIFPALITPFDEETARPEWLLKILEKFNTLPLSGYVFLGSTGETAHLSDRERLWLLREVLPAVPGEKLKIVGCTFHALKPALDFLEDGARMGAQAALVLTPHYFRHQMHAEQLVAFYRQLADRAPVPILVYHFPAVTGISLSTETLLMLSEHPNIIGCKDSAGDLALQQGVLGRCRQSFSLLTGSAATLYPSLLCGAAGGILALANLLPEACLRLYQLVQNEQWEQARSLQQRLIPLNRLVTRTYGLGGLKYAMQQLGYQAGNPRAPLSLPDARGQATIDRELKQVSDLANTFQ